MESIVRRNGIKLYERVDFYAGDDQRGNFETPQDDADGQFVSVGDKLEVFSSGIIYIGEVDNKFRELGRKGTIVCLKNVRRP